MRSFAFVCFNWSSLNWLSGCSAGVHSHQCCRPGATTTQEPEVVLKPWLNQSRFSSTSHCSHSSIAQACRHLPPSAPLITLLVSGHYCIPCRSQVQKPVPTCFSTRLMYICIGCCIHSLPAACAIEIFCHASSQGSSLLRDLRRHLDFPH